MIHNRISKRGYVGSASKNLRRRANNHRSELQRGVHGNIHLQRAWRKYGEDAFEFLVLEECEPEACLDREQYWMDYHDSYRSGYNRCPTAYSFRGRRHSTRTKRLISAANSGRAMTPENRAAMSARLKAVNPMHRPEVVAKLKKNYKGKKGRLRGERISASLTGRTHSAERCADNSFGRNYGIWHRAMSVFMELPKPLPPRKLKAIAS